MSKIRVGIIGVGFIGAAHIEAINRLGFAEVVALAGEDQASAESKASQLGVPIAYGDYRELLANNDIQVVHNCTPNHLHVKINEEIILANKHVLSEKPLSLTSQESEKLLTLARQHGVVHGVNFVYRQYPIVQQMRQMIQDGSIGEVNLIHGSYLQDWLLYDTDYNWRMEPEIGGASRAVADIGSHWCDLVQHVTGKRIVKVFADLATVIPVRLKPSGQAATFGASAPSKRYEEVNVRTEDYASVLFHMEDGARGVFTVSQVSAGRKNRLNLEVNGSERSLYWDQEDAAKLWIGARDRANALLPADPSLLEQAAQPYIHYPGGHYEGWPDAQKNMMLQFYSYIRNGGNPSAEHPSFATFEDGHRSMVLIDAILESHREGRWIEING